MLSLFFPFLHTIAITEQILPGVYGEDFVWAKIQYCSFNIGYRFKYRVIFKIVLLVYKALHGLVPKYIREIY